MTTGVQNQYKTVDVPGGGKDGRPLKMKLDIWDTAGQESQQALARNFYSGSHAVIIVYSVVSPYTFKSVDNHMNNINQYCNDENVLKFLVGNKCDLEEDRRVTFDDLLEKQQDYNIRGFETSALPERKSTIDELFSEVI